MRPPMMDDPFAPILPSQVPALAQAVSPGTAIPANQRVPTGPVSLHDPFAPIIPGSRQEDGVMPLVRPSSAPQAIHPPQQEQLAQAQPIAQAAPASASHQAAAICTRKRDAASGASSGHGACLGDPSARGGRSVYGSRANRYPRRDRPRHPSPRDEAPSAPKGTSSCRLSLSEYTISTFFPML